MDEHAVFYMSTCLAYLFVCLSARVAASLIFYLCRIEFGMMSPLVGD